MYDGNRVLIARPAYSVPVRPGLSEMAAQSRRRLRQLAAHLAPGPLSPPITATPSSSGVGGLTITSVESFRVECPLTAEQQAIMEAGRARAGTAPFIGFYNTTGVTRIRTSDPSITGYGWAECDAEAASELLLGQNPMEVERLLAAGLECIDPQLPPAFDNTAKQRFLGAENALWDVVGKACGRPLHQLWGSCRDTMALYLTTVWPYDAHQEDVTPEQQVADMVELHRRGGYTAFKIRIWRKNTMEDVRTVQLFKQALPHCQIMLDRTGDGCGHDWSHEEALQVARALKDAGATWLEECFRRDYDHTGVTAECVERNAALTAVAPLPITGGEHQPISVYHDYLSARAFDIVQPHCANLLSHLRKIGGAAQLAGVDCILHGHHGMDLIGSLQVGATIPSARMQEIVFTTPGILPEEAWAPLAVLTRGDGPLLEVLGDGRVRIPAHPGLGIDVDDEALERLRVPDERHGEVHVRS